MSAEKLTMETLEPLYAAPKNEDSLPASKLLMPFIEAGQVIIGTAQKGGEETQFGFALWAKVSDETHEALSSGELNPLATGLDGLSSGANPWIVYAVSPPQLVDALLKSAAGTVFPDQSVMARLHDEKGAARAVKIA